MKLSEKQKNEWITLLKNLGYLPEGETLVEHTAGDYWEFGFSQVRGNFFFTEKTMIFVGGMLGNNNWGVPYDKITEIKKCNAGGIIPIIPTGIKVIYADENGKSAKKVCSVLKRNDWMEFLNNKLQ
ncbi:MAG: PH domain-containing protein [Lachnospiraceae bacterium]|nr:PH domain-containing protein [Lachnospiraceae bacterium]